MLAVNPAVLIPRPESELLVELAIEWLKAHPAARRLIDLGTGSGAVAIAVAKAVPQVRIEARDVSARALRVAAANMAPHPLRRRVAPAKSGLIHRPAPAGVILAKPPYLPQAGGRAAHVAKAAERLRRGAVIAFPTDTLYAVGARARDPVAVARLYRAKQRPTGQPMVWLVSGLDQVEPDAVVTEAAGDLMRRFWPGPLTLVLPARAHQGKTTIAGRAPDHEAALTPLRSPGEPTARSS